LEHTIDVNEVSSPNTRSEYKLGEVADLIAPCHKKHISKTYFVQSRQFFGKKRLEEIRKKR